MVPVKTGVAMAVDFLADRLIRSVAGWEVAGLALALVVAVSKSEAG